MNKNVLEKKKQIVDSLVATAKDSKSLVVCSYSGLTVSEVTELRRLLSKEGSKFNVYKNTLVTKACDSLDGYKDLVPLLSGPNAFVFSKDESSGARILLKYSKTHKALQLRAGLVEGKFYDEAAIKEIASLPSKEGLISSFLSCLNFPIGKFARTLKALADTKNA